MSDTKEIEVEIGSNDSVVIEKLFGSLIFSSLRVTADVYRECWIIERMTTLPCPDPDHPHESDQYSLWVEWCTIPAQFEWEFKDDR